MAKVGGAILRSRVARQPAAISVEVTVYIRAEYFERDEWLLEMEKPRKAKLGLR